MKNIFFAFLFFCFYTANAQINCNNWLSTPSVPSNVEIGQLNIPGHYVTVEAVINRTAPYSGGQVWAGDIVSKHQNPTDANYLLRPNSGEITTVNGYFKTPDIADINLNQTYHVAMVYDGTTLKFYRNGCLMSQIAATGDLVQNSFIASIGYYSSELYPNENFIGYINEVRIWNVARTQTELRTYMNSSLPNPPTQPGLLAYYTFDNLNNKQGNAAWNGTLGGSAAINQSNPSCNAIADLCASPNDSIIINDYTEVLNLDICKNELTVADASKYNIGDTVLLIQMKGAVIDSSNSVTFGTITNYKNSGNYEFNIVKQKTGNKIDLLNALQRQYNIPDGKVQLVRVPYYQNLTTSSVLTCLPWDGSKGGVLAFNVQNSLTMNADIDVSGKGFRHGDPMNTTIVTLNQQAYYYDLASNNGAQKGESIYSISQNKNYGRGASANGAGGGNAHNSGGGGGGNGGAGGMGGDQWQTGKTIAENVGGKGGKALMNSAVLNKLYLGGSGGMGQANDQREYPAGNGGGIILISAQSLTNNSFSIKSNGEDATEAPNSAECKDGMAGGGAGGSISLNINTLTTPITLEAKGGKGADHIAQNVLHGPGGGGGGGVVAVSQIATPALYTINLSGGANGVNVYHANDPWGAAPGNIGKVINNFKPVFDQVLFQQNIDSVRFTENIHDCFSFDLKGIAFTHTSPITIWNWNFGDANSSSLQNPTHTYTSPGAYNIKLIGTDINGCKDSISKPVSLKNLNITKSPDTSLCGSSPVHIFAAGGASYSWAPVTGLSSTGIPDPIATPLATTKYYVTVSNPDGCSKKDSVKITVNSLPVISKSNDTAICKNTQAQIFANGGSSYLWSPSISLNNPNIANPVATPLTNTTYQVKVTNADGCSQTASVNVTVNPVPAISISKDSTICNNATVRLVVNGGSSYTWSPSSSLNNPAIATPLATPLATTVYHVDIRDAYSCVYKDSVKITVRKPAEFSVSPDNSVCANDSRQLSASGGDTYVWSPASFLDNPNASNPVAKPDASVTYSVTIKENTCNESATLFTKLTVLPKPNVRVSKSNDITCSSPSANLSALGAQEYIWNPGTGLSNPNISNPIATPVSNTLYTVTGKDANGCMGSDTVSVKVTFNGNILYGLPNSFTPNGDGLNDCFGVQYWGQVDQLDFSIYNRFGQKVFYTTRSTDCWDGTFKGKAQNAGAFVYVIKAKTACGNIDRKGVVILIR